MDIQEDLFDSRDISTVLNRATGKAEKIYTLKEIGVDYAKEKHEEKLREYARLSRFSKKARELYLMIRRDGFLTESERIKYGICEVLDI